MDCCGLADKWAAVESIRVRFRDSRDLTMLPAGSNWVEPNRNNAVLHADLLLPALEILRETPGYKLPYLQSLQAEIGEFYERLGRPNEKLIYRNAQELKRLLGLVKRKALKKELTKDCNNETDKKCSLNRLTILTDGPRDLHIHFGCEFWLTLRTT